jgi:hypothetical protein
VKQGWQFVLNETSVHFLLALRGRERLQLLKVLDALAEDPMQTGNFEAKDAVGRTIQIKVAGTFLIWIFMDFSG